jgi:hypothetical protein
MGAVPQANSFVRDLVERTGALRRALRMRIDASDVGEVVAVAAPPACRRPPVTVRPSPSWDRPDEVVALGAGSKRASCQWTARFAARRHPNVARHRDHGRRVLPDHRNVTIPMWKLGISPPR